MSDNHTELLCNILECGAADLYLLDDIGYDLIEIYDDLIGQGVKPTLNELCAAVFLRGIDEMYEAVCERIESLKYEIRYADAMKLDEKAVSERREELDAILLLDPRADIAWHTNCQDTAIYFIANCDEDAYRKYFDSEIETAELHMGFCID